MHTAKTQFVCQPQRNGCLLRSIAYHWHYGPAAWIDPVVLRAITISWNNIVVPVGSWPYDGHPDDGPFPWFTNASGRLRLRCGTKRAQAAQDQGRSQSYDRYPHASTSLLHTAWTKLGYPATFEFAPLLSVYRTSKTPEPQRLISRSAHNPDERSGIRGQATMRLRSCGLRSQHLILTT
jgi:hypothetical protein